jgi:hypothetical protein
VWGSSEHPQLIPTKIPRSEDSMDQQKIPGNKGTLSKKKRLQSSQVPPYSFNDGDASTSNLMDSQINIPTVITDNQYAQLDENEHQEINQQQAPTKSAKVNAQKLPW